MARAAPAAGRHGRAAPQRAVGRAHRPHASPPFPAGRRAHILCAVSNQAGDCMSNISFYFLKRAQLYSEHIFGVDAPDRNVYVVCFNSSSVHWNS